LLSSVGQDRHSPCHETEKSRTAASPKLAFREAGTQVSPVKMSRPSLRASAPPCLPLFIKGRLKEGVLIFAFCLLPLVFGLEGLLGLGVLGLWLDSFALGFLVWEAFVRKKNY
jgi:hypothetical protein